MVMGPTHALSGAAVWLSGAALSLPVVGDASLPVVVVGAAVCAGSALLPDVDCPGSLSLRDGSTAVRAFGVAGQVVGQLASRVSLLVYNLTRGRRDAARSGGHRTLTHTAVFAAAMGALVSAGAAAPGTVQLGGRSWAVGQLVALGVMWVSLHLALFGLFERWAKRQRARYGLVAVMLLSLLLTAATAAALPGRPGGYPWLGLAVGVGVAMHCLGDAVTKQGVPFLWPLAIRGKRWWEITLPRFLRIRAGGAFESAVLMPALTVVTLVAFLDLTAAGGPLVAGAASLLGLRG